MWGKRLDSPFLQNLLHDFLPFSQFMEIERSASSRKANQYSKKYFCFFKVLLKTSFIDYWFCFDEGFITKNKKRQGVIVSPALIFNEEKVKFVKSKQYH